MSKKRKQDIKVCISKMGKFMVIKKDDLHDYDVWKNSNTQNLQDKNLVSHRILIL